ncbi:MAG TPA: DUF6064 family protein [Thermoanaerobaculia bacterium]|nr:DUF6064 family protein [Thermoanaerobaculia bacterium]
MSDWWTYHLSDFLLFSARTYDRLFERYNRDVWPLHVVAVAAAVLILILALRAAPAWHGRASAAILAVIWLWIAWAFQLKRYSTIQWAAKSFAVAFIVEALLLIWFGIVRDRFRAVSPRDAARKFGIALFLFAVLIEPLLGLSGRRPWEGVQVFGIAPDPTVAANAGDRAVRWRARLHLAPDRPAAGVHDRRSDSLDAPCA